MPILPTIPTILTPGGLKKLLEFAAKNSMQAQAKSEKEIIQDLITGDNPSFYSEQTRDGGNEIDTYLYGTPYNTENTSNVGPSYNNYLSKNFPLRKHQVKTYDTHFGDTLYIDEKWKDQVLDELEQGKTVGASMGRYAHAPSYIVNTKDDQRRPYDAGGHLMQFQYDKDGNVVANMSDIYDFLPKDFEEKYGALKEYGPLKTAGMYAMHYVGTPFIVRQNGIPVRFKEIVPEYKTELQSELGNFLSEWGDTFDLTIPHRLTDEQIKEIFDGKEYGDEILDFMKQKGYLNPVFKKGGIIKYQNPGSPLLIQKVNQSGVNFVKRLLDPDRKSIPDWETKGQKIATHKMSWGEDDQGAYVFPEVQEIDDQLIDFSRPPYAPGIADYMAHKNNNIIRMSPEEADWFTRNYKQYYPSFKKGGRIHIKKKNRGKFTDYCKGKVTEECIAKGKKSKDPKIRKRATFAQNVRSFKHSFGGLLADINYIKNMFNGTDM